MELDWSSPWIDHIAYILEHLEDLDLTPEEGLALLVIEHSNRHNVPVSHALLEAKLHTTLEHAEDVLNALADKGYLSCVVERGSVRFVTDGVLEGVSRTGLPIEKSLIQEFEQGFGRALSGQEMQRIIDLGSLYDQDRILIALDEACAYEHRDLNYVERVLISWKNKGITTEDLKKGIRK